MAAQILALQHGAIGCPADLASAANSQRAPLGQLMRIAIAGCGQLARMLALAGWEMGHQFSFMQIPAKAPTASLELGLICTWDVHTPINELYDALGKPDVVTIEKEHVDITLMEGLAEHCLVAPSPDAIRACQHRGREKTLLQSLGIMTAPSTWLKMRPH